MSEREERPGDVPPPPADDAAGAASRLGPKDPPGAADPSRPVDAAGAAGAPPGSAGRVEELEELLAQAAEEKDRVLRAYADADNDRKRAVREREDAVRYGAAGLARSLLGAVDSLERALAAAPAQESGPAKALQEGVALTLQEVLAALRGNGVERVAPEAGDAFNPDLHQAVQRVERDDMPAGAVAELLQPGYMLRDRLLRAASVVVAKAPEADGAEDGGRAPKGKAETAPAAEDSGAGAG